MKSSLQLMDMKRRDLTRMLGQKQTRTARAMLWL
jgi:hypothetical protein